jgi:predicted nucleotidyltransferase
MPKASDIRKEMRANNVEGITNMDDFWEVIKGKLLTTDSEDNLIKYLKNQLSNGCYASWYDFVEGSANKSFTKARISRDLLKWTLNLKDEPITKYRVLGATPKGLEHLRTVPNYTTGFNSENQNELKVAEFLDLKYPGYKEKEVKTPIIIFKPQSLNN